MRDIVYSFFFILSLTLFLFNIIYCVITVFKPSKKKRLLNKLQHFAVITFVSIVLMYIPYYYTDYFAGFSFAIIKPFFIALHNTIRVFVIDGEFDAIRDAANQLDNQLLGISYSFYFSALFIIAPALTAGFILSLFKNLSAEIRFKYAGNHNLYIMSELNEKSITLAESIIHNYSDKERNEKEKKAKRKESRKIIRKKLKKAYRTNKKIILSKIRNIYSKKKPTICEMLKRVFLKKNLTSNRKPLIIFTDVFTQNKEVDYELLSRAKNIKALYFQKDVTAIELSRLKRRHSIEYFLIGMNESENINQSIRIIDAENARIAKRDNNTESESTSKKNYSKKPPNKRKVKVDKTALEKKIKLFIFSSKPDNEYVINSLDKKNVMAWRVNEIRSLVWNTVMNSNILDMTVDRLPKYKCAHGINPKTISILLVGLGEYGMEFFKMLIWFCQIDGYNLEINIVEKKDARKAIESQCPEILCKNKHKNDGTISYNYDYDIEFFPYDVFSSDFFNSMFYDGSDSDLLEMAARLHRTTVVFATLGDDDENISASIHIRELFDSVNGITKGDISHNRPISKIPDIFTVVYNRITNENMTHKNADKSDNQDDVQLKNYKEQAYYINLIGSITDSFKYTSVYNEALEEQAKKYHVEWVEIDKQIYKITENDDIFNEYKDFDLNASIKAFNNFDYYRWSSLAKAIHRNAIKNNSYISDIHTCKTDKGIVCKCDACNARRKSEHSRWNAYMRTCGYRYGKLRNDRAKIHNNLVEYDELSEMDKLKDS